MDVALWAIGERWQQQDPAVAEVSEVKVPIEAAVAESLPAVGSSAPPLVIWHTIQTGSNTFTMNLSTNFCI